MKKQLFIVLGALLICFNTNAQSKKLTITVKDEKNNPLPGAIILFDNVKQKRWTNAKGIFKIKLKKKPKTISAFSALHGIKTLEYNDQNNLTMIVKGKKDNLDLVASNPKQTVAGAKQFLNIYDYLRGKTPGVSVGSNNSIRIRGYSTFNGGRGPLLMLNGFQIDANSFAGIVPTTIKKVKILKGPETAMYGVRGANGVIMVETL